MPISDEDKALLRQAMQDVTPLSAKKRVVAQASPTKPIKTTPPSLPIDHAFIGLPQACCEMVSPETPLLFHRPGLSAKDLNALKAGEQTPEYILDLHGLTIEQAEEALALALQQPARLLKIIHGHGLGILKNHVNRWLRADLRVLAFCSTPARFGGTGALYVRLTGKKHGNKVK